MITKNSDNRLVLATNNTGKVDEFKSMLASSSVCLLTMGEFNIESPDETGQTFMENALLKARHTSKLTGLPALADDSGLVVPALNGAPGIYSSRYSGLDATDASNRELLLQELNGVTDRRAYYVCALVEVQRHDDPVPIMQQSFWYGDILHDERGEYGFGYDSLFLVKGSEQTAAEMTEADKNNQSHRAKALHLWLQERNERLLHGG